MKNSIVSIVAVFLVLMLFVNCSENKDNGKEILTEEKADEIIKKYGLESTFNKQNLSEFKAKGKNTNRNIDISAVPEITTVEEFEELVASIAERENSIEGRIAKKTNEFFELAKKRNKKYTKREVDSFYKALDKEFGTDLFEKVRKPMNESSGVKFSTFEEIE